MGTSAGLCGAPAPNSPPGGPASPGANREAVFLLAGKQAPCVCLRTDSASDEEPGASKSARGSRMELTTGPPWPGQPFLGGCPRSSAAGWGHQRGQGAWAWVATPSCCTLGSLPPRDSEPLPGGSSLGLSPALHPPPRSPRNP